MRANQFSTSNPIHEILTLTDQDIQHINNNPKITFQLESNLMKHAFSYKDFLQKGKINIDLLSDFLKKLNQLQISEGAKEYIFVECCHTDYENEARRHMLFYAFILAASSMIMKTKLLPPALFFLSLFIQCECLQPMALDLLKMKEKIEPFVGKRISDWICNTGKLINLPFRLFFRTLHRVKIMPEHDQAALKDTVINFLTFK